MIKLNKNVLGVTCKSSICKSINEYIGGDIDEVVEEGWYMVEVGCRGYVEDVKYLGKDDEIEVDGLDEYDVVSRMFGCEEVFVENEFCVGIDEDKSYNYFYYEE